MNKTGIPYLDFCWNPCGYGCSNIAYCPTCWSRRQATGGGPTGPTCPDCKAFKVHFHAERMQRDKSPEGRRKPAVVGVQFLGDLFDQARPIEQILAVLELMTRAPQHTYVMLTQQPARAETVLDRFYTNHCCSACKGIGYIPKMYGQGDSQHAEEIPCRTCGGRGYLRGLHDNWFIGATIKDASGVWSTADLGHLLSISGRRWLSVELINGPIDRLLNVIPAGAVEGIVISTDNQPSVPFHLAWVIAAVHSLTTRHWPLATKVYVKQLWLWVCPNCDAVHDSPAGFDLGNTGVGCCPCGCPASQFRKTLVTDHTEYPADLQLRQLPWALTVK